ncbi:MAG: pyridoxal phosphate-dependent aminotransferase family protein [Pseudomonadota bacterium]
MKQLLEDRELRGGGTSELLIDGRPFLNFSGCNYLALTNHIELRDAAQSALDEGVGFSRYLVHAYGGNDPYFDAVEQEAAKFFGTEAAVYLPSGYMIGAAGFAAADPEYDVILLDETAHWCLVDAAILTGKPIRYFAHRSPAALSREIEQLGPGQRPLVVTDGAFATLGALPPLDEYAVLLRACHGKLLVDESHSGGVVGATGRGTVQHFGVEDIAHVGVTLSKAFCGQGAVYVGSLECVERARACKPVRGSNSGTPISANVCAAALKFVRENPDVCAKARDSAEYLRSRLRGMGLDVASTPTSIVAFSHGNFSDMRAIQERLFQDGIYVLHSNYIASGPGGVIRLSVFADHTMEQLEQVANAIQAAI